MRALILIAVSCDAVRIASLSNHHPDAWSPTSGCLRANATGCNLHVYEAAAEAAASLGAKMIVYPEAYGLQNIDEQFEPYISDVGTRPCAGSLSANAPQQSSLACFAERYNIAIAASVFAKLPNGTNRIMEMVYDAQGSVVVSYSKHKLIPVFESRYAKAGPFLPTVFSLAGLRWGIVICYEGVYPTTPWGNWDQIDALKAHGAQAILWSIGSMVPQKISSDIIAKHSAIAVAASEDKARSTFFGANGTLLPHSSLSLTVSGYTADATVTVADVDDEA